MIKLINNITQIIILLGCCAISIFILFVLITFIKNVDDLAAITKLLNMTYQLNLKIKKLSRQIETQLILQLQLKKH